MSIHANVFSDDAVDKVNAHEAMHVRWLLHHIEPSICLLCNVCIEFGRICKFV